MANTLHKRGITAMRSAILVIGMLCTPMVSGSVIRYEADVLPEDVGFERGGTFNAERWLADGWFCHHVDLGQWAPPPGGEQDYHRYYGLGAFTDESFFIEWRMMSDAPDSEVDHQKGAALMVLVGGPVTYHFNIASGLARILRGVQYPVLYFDIEPGVPHAYRLEVYGGDYFEFQIDGVVMDSGEPEAVWPTPDALLGFASRYYRAESTAQWDYVHFGTIPKPVTGLLVLLGVGVVLRRRFARR